LLTGTGGVLLYLITAGIDYHFFFDKRLEKHPKFLPNQISKELSVALKSIPQMAVLSLPFFLLDVNGKTMMVSLFRCHAL
jgi:lathosterol oxidase